MGGAEAFSFLFIFMLLMVVVGIVCDITARRKQRKKEHVTRESASGK